VIFRRKELPPELRPAEAAFELVLGELEPGKVAITDVLPGTRMPGRPLHDALQEYERRLAAASVLMPGWRRSELEAQWVACDAGLSAARSLTRRAREEALDVVGFEGMLGLVEELLDPLDPFAEAEARFRQLRGRRRDAHG
jgi:hypothetical protein